MHLLQNQFKGDGKVNISKKKLFFVLLVIFLIIFDFGVMNVYGFTVNDLGGERFQSQNATNFANKLVTILSTIGSVLSVVVLICLGIKYMLGSVEEKASYKKSMMPYIIGAGIVFMASTIAGILYSFITNM